jgi:SH3 domain protein
MLRFAGIILLVLPFSVAAESVYVIDQLTIGIFSGPNDQEPEIKRARSGDLLEVIERAEGAIKVRDAAGTEGWVRVNLVTSAKPARVQLNAARAEAERLKLELNASKAQLQSLNVRLKQAEDNLSNEKNLAMDLNSQIKEQKAREEAAIEKVAKAENSTPIISNEIAYGMWIFISLGMLVGGFIVGYSWVREKYRRKLGGMYLRM